jgi:hypothetical protein
LKFHKLSNLQPRKSKVKPICSICVTNLIKYSTTSIIRTHVTSDTPIIRRLPRFGHFAIFVSIIRTNQNIKVSYRKDLVNYIISHEDDNIVQLLTSSNNKKKEWALGENNNVDCDLTDEQIVQETLNNNHGDDENECE